MNGFFELEVAEPAVLNVPQCGLCGLWKKCQSPKMEPSGKGRRRVLIVGEAGGKAEDEKGIQFVGKSGKYLQWSLSKIGVDMRKDCWMDNALRCHPKDNIIKDKRAIDWCRPNLIDTIKELEPEVIVLLGGVAIQSLIGHLWKDDIGAVGRWVGWRIPCQRFNAWICPTWHPSGILREGNEIQEKWFLRHLKAAFRLKDRPWKEAPDFASQVEVILDPDKAAKILGWMLKHPAAIAFDFETESLKPDSKEVGIVSCAVCWKGRTTVSYPWHGEAVKATGELLRSKEHPKIGSNIKFEERWTRKIFGHGVKGWQWDTMLAAHVIDNRTGVTGLKFQAFVNLGQESYDFKIKPFLESKAGNSPNRIREAKLEDLLHYGGLDALLECKLAEVQMRKLGFPNKEVFHAGADAT